MLMKKKTFTLVEMLIVIAVFGTGILTVLYGLSQTLRMQDRADMMVSASFLAREGIELIYNLRDANYAKKLDWNCIFRKVSVSELKKLASDSDNPFCAWYFTGGDLLKLSMGTDWQYLAVERLPEQESQKLENEWFDALFQKYQLFYLIDGARYSFVYTGEHQGEPLRYARYIKLQPVTDGIDVLPLDKILKVESHVLYKKGALTGESIMETFIWNY